VLWRLLLTAAGGVRVTGRPTSGPCVIVANHSSHADTAVLLAAIPSRRRPAVAAAADYWFARRGRRLLCRAACAAFPVRRGGGGSGDLAAAARLLAAGRDVVVFPEGTRSRDGRPGAFHTGAVRLARAAGVPVVPVRIEGTGALLPVHGRPRRARVRVEFAAPLDPSGPEEAVAGLTELIRRTVTRG
jgi:1-acyl-sn-glycerol-3-phosphate acyltransferase